MIYGLISKDLDLNTAYLAPSLAFWVETDAGIILSIIGISGCMPPSWKILKMLQCTEYRLFNYVTFKSISKALGIPMRGEAIAGPACAPSCLS